MSMMETASIAIDVAPRPVRPEHEAHQEDEGEHEFVAGHRPHLLEFVTRDLTCIRNLPDFGRRNPEEDERHEEQADEARHDGGDRPLHPGELDADGDPRRAGCRPSR